MRSVLRFLMFLYLPALFGLCTAVPCRAGLVITSETVTASPGGSGLVQILIRNDSAVDLTLSGFSIDIDLGGTGVQFTSADDQTSPAYVFEGNGTGTLTFDLFPNEGFLESDVDLSTNGFATLGAGETFGLGRIRFGVQGSAAAGLRAITLGGPMTQFIDGRGAAYLDRDLTFVGGGVQVGVGGNGVAVPEPSMLTAGLTGVALTGAGLWWRRRKAAG
jgi:hypothetical protein